MSTLCRGCGIAFGQVKRRHRLHVQLENGLMLGGSFCNDCYGPLATRLLHELAQAGKESEKVQAALSAA